MTDNNVGPDEESLGPDRGDSTLSSAPDGGAIERAAETLLGELGIEGPPGMEATVETQALSSTFIRRLSGDVYKKGLGITEERAARTLSALAPAIVASEHIQKVLPEFSVEAVLGMEALPRWVQVQARAYNQWLNLGADSGRLNSTAARLTITEPEVRSMAHSVVAATQSEIERMPDSAFALGCPGTVVALAFSMLTCVSADMFITIGLSDVHELIATEFADISRVAQQRQPLFDVVSTAMVSRSMRDL